MKIHCFRHAEFEFLGHISLWAQQNRYETTSTHFFSGDLPQENLKVDLLVILGGPMNVYEEKLYPWLIEEKKAIASALLAGTKILGICLGAQLIASVLGAQVRKNSHQEIGWHTVTKDDCPKTSPLNSFPQNFKAFQWHGDTFEIPHGATRGFSSSLCTNQGFTYENQIIGFQFHPEIDQLGIKELLMREYTTVIEGPGVQTRLEILQGQSNINSQRENFFRMLNIWLRPDQRLRQEPFDKNAMPPSL